MTITEYADIINQNIKLTYYHNQNGRWCASFLDAEVADGAILKSEHGNGPTPQDAIMDYVNEIKGKRLVFDATSRERRREYVVPQSLVGL